MFPSPVKRNGQLGALGVRSEPRRPSPRPARSVPCTSRPQATPKGDLCRRLGREPRTHRRRPRRLGAARLAGSAPRQAGDRGGRPGPACRFATGSRRRARARGRGNRGRHPLRRIAARRRQLLGGRINVDTGSSLRVRYSDGSVDKIPLGNDRYFLFEIPAEHRASVHADGLELIAENAQGAVVGRATVPADWDGPAVPDEQAPLYASTRSDESDFTKVYGLEGHVSAARATQLELAYGDGTRATIPIQPDGSYDYTVPADRIGDFMQPRSLEALDEHGVVVARTWVAAVAYWRGRERGGP